jgi:hypothetical protein
MAKLKIEIQLTDIKTDIFVVINADISVWRYEEIILKTEFINWMWR